MPTDFILRFYYGPDACWVYWGLLYLFWGVGWLFTSSLNYYSVSLFFIDNMMLLLLYYYFSHYQYYLPFCFLLVILAGSLSLVAFLQLFGIWQSYSSVFIITGTFDTKTVCYNLCNGGYYYSIV